MRLMLVGSVPTSSADLETVSANLGRLVVAAVTAGHEIVIRNPARGRRR